MSFKMTPKDQPATDGDAAVVKPRRGRPPKQGKLKIQYTIIATGKGRGRPKKPQNAKEYVKGEDWSDYDDSEDGGDGNMEENTFGAEKKTHNNNRYTTNSDADEFSEPHLLFRILKKHKKPGRPRKVPHSDTEDDYDMDKREEERRPVGRPPTGAVSFNIIRTGRKQGRPRKPKPLYKRKTSPLLNFNDGMARKRGRPSSGKGPYTPTGKPRGRPKKNVNKSERGNDNDAEHRKEDVIVDDKDAKREQTNLVVNEQKITQEQRCKDDRDNDVEVN